MRLSVALRRRPPANRRERRALGTHALAREAEIMGGAGEMFPRSFELFEICRTFGTLPGNRETRMALADIAGQKRAMRFLKRLLQKDAIPHAFLFSGMAGTGKFAAAKEFAKALNCMDPQDYDSCGVCTACHKME